MRAVLSIVASLVPVMVAVVSSLLWERGGAMDERNQEPDRKSVV